MGEKRVHRADDQDEMRLFKMRLLRDVHAFERLLATELIESGVRRIGAEQEMFLVGTDWRPATMGPEVLREIDDPAFTTELGRFNLEANAPPLLFEAGCLDRLADEMGRLIAVAREGASRLGVDVLLTGILPTLRKSDLDVDNMTPEERYYALNDAMNELRGGAYNFYIKGTDELLVNHDSVMLESCNTSFQIHFQVGPGEFARLYNIAQVVTAPVLAAAVNSPLLFGRRLWHETRIALFQQSVDTRYAQPNLREIQPRVTFGNGWVRDSVLEIFRDDISRFSVLLGTDVEEDPLALVERGEAPRLQALQLFNSTVYRWNRPCYGVKDGIAHLRIENRVLPAGPSLTDEIANAAFWFGMVAGLAESAEDVTEHMEFDTARDNFRAAARLGLGAPIVWLDGEQIGARDLILNRLLDLARAGLQAAGLETGEIDRHLGVVRARVEARRTGASWQLESLAAMKEHGSEEERLRALTASIANRQLGSSHVAEWAPATIEEAGAFEVGNSLVEHYMTTDLVTVNEDDPVDLVANVMDWHKIRHIPVEAANHRLIGLITRRTLLRFLASEEARRAERPVPVGEIMQRDLITVTPKTTTLEAIEIMRRCRISALPVVAEGRLIGMITERDYLNVARELLESRLTVGPADGRRIP